MRPNIKIVLIVVIGVGSCLLSILFSQYFREKDHNNQLVLSRIDKVAVQIEQIQLLGRSFIQDGDETSWRQILQTMQSVRRNLQAAPHTVKRWRQAIEALNRSLEDYDRILTQLYEPAVALNAEKKAFQKLGLTFSREVEEEIIKPYRKQEGLLIYDGKSTDPFKARAKDAAYDLVAWHTNQQLILLELLLSSDLEAYKHKKENLSNALVQHNAQLRYISVLMGNELSIQSVLDSLDQKISVMLDHEQAITERFAALEELNGRLRAAGDILHAAGRELSSRITSDTLRISSLNRILNWSLLLGILGGLSVLGALLARNIIHFVEDLKATQQKLRQSESILTATLESTNDGVLVVTGIGNVSHHNSRFCEIWSIPDGVMASGDDKVLVDYVVPQLVEPEQFISKIEELYQTSKTSEDVLHFRDGRILERFSYPLVREGEESGRVWFFRDVTERKRIEEELIKSAEQYSVMTSTSMDGFVIVDRNGSLLDVNDAYSRMIGYSRDELLKMSISDIEVVATPDQIQAKHQKIVGGSDRFESHQRCKDGRVINVEISMTHLLRSDHVLIFLRDITERKQAEEALRDSEQRLRLALMAANQGLYDLNLETGDVITSAEYALMLGYDPAEFKETATKWIERLHPEDHDRVAGVYEAYLRGEPADYQLEFRQRTESGDWKWILSLGRIAERNADGKPVRMLGTHTDITERKRAEEELARHRDRLEELVKERTRELESAQKELIKRERLAVLGKLTATVSHELRNPLGVIRSSAFYLQRKLRGMDEKVDKHVDRVERQVVVCDSIVNDLLEYTRGKHVEKLAGEINPWIAEVLDQMATPQGIEVIRQFAPGIPPVLFDKEKMRRAVVNLIENAVQAVTEKQQGFKEEVDHYQPQVKVVTTLRVDGVVIEVADNGVGMDDETAKHAFEALFTTRARGTGLGLAIVRKIVEEHGGYVFLESRTNEGTKVSIVMPAMSKEVH